jgi:GNAT superfamily N-acetyltransferase
MSPPETGIRSRPATQDDLPILWDFVAIAAYEPDADAAKAVPFVAAHLAGWKRPEDFGFIAERDGLAIGAAWARQFARDEQPAFFVDERTPEVTIEVKPAIRGRGVGRMLLDAMLAEAARRGVGLCLNVRLVVPAKADFILSKALKSERADPARSRKPIGRVSGFRDAAGHFGLSERRRTLL